MQSLQAAVLDLRVELGCGDAGVPEQFLQFTYAGSSGEHVRCKTVPQGVRTDVSGNSRAGGIFFDEVPEGDSRELIAATSQEQPGGRLEAGQCGAFGVEVFRESGPDHGAGDERQSFLVPLSQAAAQSLDQVNISQLQAGDFRGAASGSVEQPQL